MNRMVMNDQEAVVAYTAGSKKSRQSDQVLERKPQTRSGPPDRQADRQIDNTYATECTQAAPHVMSVQCVQGGQTAYL